MKLPLATLFAATLIFAGCATQPKEQIAAVRAAGVSSALVQKLEHGGRLSPEDIIELKRRHVNDAVALRQLDATGVDYVVDKDIIRRLRKAGVSESVITATTNAGERFAEQFQRPYVSAWFGPSAYPYPYDPYYYGYATPYSGYYPAYRGGYGYEHHPSHPGGLPHHLFH